MDEILDFIKEKLSSVKNFEGITYSKITNYNCLEISGEKLLETAKTLKSEAEFDQLIDVVGTDRFTKNDRFEVIYNLWSNNRKVRIFLRVKLDSKKPEVVTLCNVWPSANWLEREAYDMFGIVFLDHPDLRRIYMMDEFQYYPLRKDYPLMGIPGAVELPKK
jgi:NADH-quinone oxidoreductase subunit C